LRLREQRRDNWNESDSEDPFRLRSVLPVLIRYKETSMPQANEPGKQPALQRLASLARVFKMGDEALATLYR
jgi:hypothetical protein